LKIERFLLHIKSNNIATNPTLTKTLYINLQINIKEMFTRESTLVTTQTPEPDAETIQFEVIDTAHNNFITNTSPIEYDTEQKECVICYELLNYTKNVCITVCGHKFCFSCMMKHVQRNNGCPLCRTAIIEDDSVVESEEDDDDDDETIEEEIDNSYPEFEIEKFVEAFEAKGYGVKDALSVLLHKFSKTDEKFTREYIDKLETDIEDMHEELQNECEERVVMAMEDNSITEQLADITTQAVVTRNRNELTN
jgi:hypothetical protein